MLQRLKQPVLQQQGKQIVAQFTVFNINNMLGDACHPYLRYVGMSMKIIYSVILFFLCFASLASASGISVGGTRFVYMDNKREISIPIFNSNEKKPFLIQSWVTGFNEDIKAPFIATPALFRVEPNSYGAARIAYLGQPLSSNQEKIFLLNIKSIPPKDESIENELQIIINSQFKLFLRSNDIEPLSFDNITLTKEYDGIKINNKTPYHLSIKSILINGKSIKGIKMVYPWVDDYIFKGKIDKGHVVTVEFINDYGAIVEKKITKS
ncbi:fimbrial biogenesis chaperone [Providencia sp. JUb39]|uniref:fimbrial biogenesis chaperone n=1 Tax=Providencia sp. JUb39 TaxID=2724165 RepID=UPI002108153E|nr:molecular chaperone [Providencia sp. JUb39]